MALAYDKKYGKNIREKQKHEENRCSEKEQAWC